MNNQDREYLKLLSIFYYVLGGIYAFLSIGLVFYSVWLSSHFFQTTSEQNSISPIILIPTLFGLLIGLTHSILLIASGRSLAKRKRYRFSFIVACIECVFLPFGTILGVLIPILYEAALNKASRMKS